MFMMMMMMMDQCGKRCIPTRSHVRGHQQRNRSVEASTENCEVANAVIRSVRNQVLAGRSVAPRLVDLSHGPRAATGR